MHRVYCIDPGYSLKEAMCLYEKGRFQAHSLYGVNGLLNYDIVPIFQSKRNIYQSNLLCNLRSLFELRKEDFDCIYIPFIDWGWLIVLCKKIKIINKPIVAVAHVYKKHVGSSVASRIKCITVNTLRKVLYRIPDKLIFINRYAYDEYVSESGNRNNALFIPLQPEIVAKGAPDDNCTIDILSVGKTNRDYKPIIEFAIRNQDCNIIIIGDASVNEDINIPNLHIIHKFLYFDELNDYYRKASIIIVPVKETRGGYMDYQAYWMQLLLKSQSLLQKPME